jgi:hypothetical protein
VYGRLLRAWARADAGETARVAATAAGRVDQLLAASARPGAVPAPAARRARPEQQQDTRRSGA